MPHTVAGTPDIGEVSDNIRENPNRFRLRPATIIFRGTRNGERFGRGATPKGSWGRVMIWDVPLVGVFVFDQDAALAFYTEKLGLVKVRDEPCGEGARWVTVSPAGTGVEVVLRRAEREHERAMVGRSDGAPVLTLGTTDVDAAYGRLRGLGVRFLGEPYRFPGGIGALLLDQDGSPILLRQGLAEP